MRPTRAVVDLGRLRHNVRALGALLGPGTQQMAVVKADAYGHGAVPVARAALDAGARWLGVALVEEGRELRAAGLEAPILVLGATEPEDADAALALDLTLTVSAAPLAQAVAAAACAAGRRAPVHLKVDTGMGRLGVADHEAADFAAWLQSLAGLQLTGVFSHFASADEADLGFSRLQLERFHAVLAALRSRGIDPGLRHMANTAATMVLASSHLDLVRTGIGIYGLYPSEEVPRGRAELRPVLSLHTRIAHLKTVAAGTPLSYGRTYRAAGPRRIATLPIGYGDGYPRLLSNRGRVLVRAQEAPIVGRVCMDMMLVDVSAVAGVDLGEPVVLIGAQDDAEISADELARHTGTINYEITCAVGKRVPRSYREPG